MAHELVLTFSSVHELLLAERVLGGAEGAWATIPVPTGIASDCGYCLVLGVEGGEEESARAAEVVSAGLGLGAAGPRRSGARDEAPRPAALWIGRETTIPGSRRPRRIYERFA